MFHTVHASSSSSSSTCPPSPSPSPSPLSRTATIATLTDIPDDVLRAHILILLDGPTLASLSSTSKHLHSLIATSPSSSALWSFVCHTEWPSTLSPVLRHVIRSFPQNSHLSFFSLSYPVVTPSPSSASNPIPPLRTQSLISAVDIRHRGNLIFSKAAETETASGWFSCSPFRIDMLEPKEVVLTGVPYSSSSDDDETWRELEDNLTVSWIVVDPEGKRAANVSSCKAVKVERHWLSGEVHARFGTVMCGERGTAREYVEWGIVVRCGGARGKLEVREVSVQAEDMDGAMLSGRESLGVLERSAFGGRTEGRSGRRDEGEGKRRYEEFLERKKERKERRARREGRLDCCLCVGLGMVAFLGFWFFVRCR